MKSKVKIMLTVLIIVAIFIVASATSRVDCSYSNYNGTFTFEEMNSQERNFEMCERKFYEFKKENRQDTVLYRLCKKQFFRFWNWGNYLSQKKFSLPYKSWKEIQTRRGELTARSGFQDF